LGDTTVYLDFPASDSSALRNFQSVVIVIWYGGACDKDVVGCIYILAPASGFLSWRMVGVYKKFRYLFLRD
jgi:hypothetical protein